MLARSQTVRGVTNSLDYCFGSSGSATHSACSIVDDDKNSIEKVNDFDTIFAGGSIAKDQTCGDEAGGLSAGLEHFGSLATHTHESPTVETGRRPSCRATTNALTTPLGLALSSFTGGAAARTAPLFLQPG